MAYSAEKLKTIVIERSDIYKRVRSALGESHSAFVLEQNTQRAAKDEWMSPDGFIKFAVRSTTFLFSFPSV